MAHDRTQPATPAGNPLSTGEQVAAATPDPGSTQPTSRPGGEPPGGLPDVPGYEVTGEIARGGMGRVLAATDLAFDREVAVKVMLPGFASDEAAGRFVRESQITGRLAHPGIPPAYQLGRLPDGSPFLAMKLIRGRTLADLLTDRPTPAHDLPRFVGVFEQIAQAVGYAHSEGVIHRDIKPANVMVGAFGEVQVMDWGLARVRDEGEGMRDEGRTADASGFPSSLIPSPSSLTQAGAVMGTPAYMAPEQARGEDVDARADVFALGGILCVVLTGAAPFRGSSGGEVVGKAAAGDVADALARLDGCGADPELIDVAKRCLAAAAAARPADGTAVAGLVAAYRAGVDERLRTAERERAAAEARAEEEANTRREAEAKTAEQRKRRKAQLVAAVVAVLLVAGAGGVAVWRVDEEGKKRADAVRLEGEERDRQAKAAADAERQARAERDRTAKAADGVAALLDQAATALAGEDAALAGRFLDQAARRADEGGVADHAARLAAYRTDRTMVEKLQAVDLFRFSSTAGQLPPAAAVGDRWKAAFAGYGIVPGATPPAVAAARINGSAIRSTLLAVLDEWSAVVAGVGVVAFLDAADPDDFRHRVRGLLAAADRPGLAAVADHPAWAAQPGGLVRAYGASPEVPAGVGTALLERAARARPADFLVLATLSARPPVDSPDPIAVRLRWLQAALAARPASVFALVNMGVALDDAGDPAAAEVHLREAVRLDPKNARAHSHLGVVRHAQGDLDGALAHHQHAVRLDPADASPHNNLGKTLFAKGDVDAAVAEFRECIRLDPQLAQPYVNLGAVYLSRKQPDLAIRQFRTAIRFNPREHTAHNNLGLALDEKGNYPDAEAAFRDALRLRPNDPEVHYNLGNTLYRRDDLDGAVRCYREAVRLRPAFGLAHYNLGLMLSERRDLAGAEAAFREAVRWSPKHATAHNSLGLILEGRLDLPGAEAAYREAVRLDPGLADAHANLGDVFRKQGRHAEAVASYRAALAIQSNLYFAREGLDYCLRLQRGEVPAAPPPRPVSR